MAAKKKKVRSQRAVVRETAEARRVRSEEGGADAQGRERNQPGQAVHQEGEQMHAAHEENSPEEISDLYDVDGRENEIVEWRRHSDLDAPPAREGYVNRFVRIRLGTVRDTARLRNALREGWRPVLRESVNDRTLPSIHLEQFGDVIGVEDLLLCEMPEHAYKKRQKFFSDKKQRQNAAIERQLRAQSQEGATGFGPIEQQRASSVTNRPRNVQVADDEV